MFKNFQDVEELLMDDVYKVDWDQEFESNSAHYDVRLCCVKDNNGNVVVAYGAYNKVTGVRETEARSLDLVRAWIRAVERDLLTADEESAMMEQLSDEDVEFISDFDIEEDMVH